MINKQIIELVKNPLVQALLGDVVMFQGLDQVRQILARRRTRPRNRQEDAAPTNASSQIPKELHRELLKLTDHNKLKEVAEWLGKLPRAHKAEISKWEATELEALFRLPADIRTSLISAVTGPTPAEELAKLKQWFTDQIPTLNDKSKTIIKEWKDWADDILAQP